MFALFGDQTSLWLGLENSRPCFAEPFLFVYIINGIFFKSIKMTFIPTQWKEAWLFMNADDRPCKIVGKKSET